jgi:hypothetical protein
LAPWSSYGVIGMPSAMNHFNAGSKAIVWSAFAAPGMLWPTSPESVGSVTPKRGAMNVQKLVLPAEVVLIDPVGSATPW